MNKLFFQQQKINILNELINFSFIKIARKYLDLLKNNRKINTNEIILEILDTSVYLSEKDIDINDKNFFKKKFRKFNKKERNQILHSLKNQNNDKIYKELAIELGIIFWIIKDKKMQDKVFNILYNSYIENNEDINILLFNNNHDFYSEFKTEFINNIHNNKFDFNLST